MNYIGFKKAIAWLALLCVFAIPVAATFTPTVSAQGYYRRDRNDRDYWRRRQMYRQPDTRYRYYGPRYRYGYYDRYGRFHRTDYYGRRPYYRRYY
jgi:hypothetical protein